MGRKRKENEAEEERKRAEVGRRTIWYPILRWSSFLYPFILRILSLSIHSSYPFLYPFIQEKMRGKDRKERMFSLSGQFQEKVVMNHKEKNDHLCPGSFPCLCSLQTWMKLNWSQMKVCTSWRETTIRLFFPSSFHSENFSGTFSSVTHSLTHSLSSKHGRRKVKEKKMWTGQKTSFLFSPFLFEGKQ